MNNKLLKMLLVTTSLSTILLGTASDSLGGNQNDKYQTIQILTKHPNDPKEFKSEQF